MSAIGNPDRRIFIGPVEIAGYYLRLSEGMASLGKANDYVTLSAHPFGYARAEDQGKFIEFIQKITKLEAESRSKKKIKRVMLLGLELLLRCVLLLISIFRYDVFIFGYGQSLLPFNLDLPILKLFRKRVIINLAHGSEARPPYLSGIHLDEGGGSIADSESMSRKSDFRKQRVRYAEKYADIVIGAPFSSSYFLSRKMINWFALGIPVWADSSGGEGHWAPPSYSSTESAPLVRILHCPSRQAVKGSDAIRMAIDNLHAKGKPVDYIELIGRPNAEVIKEIQRCDFVVDQTYSDTPMAGFAAEAAGFGKPAVIGGYGFEYLKNFVPSGMYPPSKTCKPEEIEAAIEFMVDNPNFRRRLGAEAQDFVRNQWSVANVAGRYLSLIEDDIPDDWWLDPEDVVYLHGCGQSEEKTKDAISKMVNSYGPGSLQLSHRPELEKAFLDFADIKSN